MLVDGEVAAATAAGDQADELDELLEAARRRQVDDLARETAAGVGGEDEDPAELVVTLDEAARITNRANATVRNDFIVRGAAGLKTRGRVGQGWEIYARRYMDWLRGEERREASEREARLRSTSQMRLDFGGGTGAAAEAAETRLSPRQQIEALDAEARWLKVAREREALVEVDDVALMVAELGKLVVGRLSAVPDELARLGLSAELEEAARERVEAILRELAAAVRALEDPAERA